MKEYEVWMRSHPWHGDKRQVLHVMASSDSEAIERAFRAMVWEEGPGARTRWFVYLSRPAHQDRGVQPAEDVRLRWEGTAEPSSARLDGPSSVVGPADSFQTGLGLLKEAATLLHHNPGHEPPCEGCMLETRILDYLRNSQ